VRSIVIDGYEFAYREVGTGPVALFVHGFPLDGTMWDDQLARLAEARRCVAPDLRGFGRSDPPGDAVLTMERHADDLAHLCGALGADRVDLVGLSMGGYVALAFAERYPERLRSLALVDTRAAADTEEGRAARDLMATRVVTEGRGAVVDELMAALLGPDATLGVRARLRSMIEGTRYETLVGALAGMKLRPDRTGVLGGLDLPVAVVVGEHDRLTPPAAAEAMARATPRAEFTVVPGAGHMAPMERPDGVAGALRRLWSRAGEAATD